MDWRLTTMLLLLIPGLLQAQTTIHGTVVDQQTRAPIAGASVLVTGTTTSTSTNDAGNFTLTARGEVASLTVSGLGYATAQVDVTDPTKPVLVRLAPAPVTLPGVEVVGQPPLPSVAVVTQSKLQTASGLNLESAINTVPGVFMQSRTPWGGARITIRGYYPSTSGNSPNSNGLGYQVFLNDIPITDATGVTVLDDIDYATLGRVDVIKGPASSRYGSAIGGTVNLTTVRPAPNQTSFGEQALAGSDGLFRSTTTIQSATGASAVVLNYGRQEYDSFRPHSGSSKDFVRASGDFTAGERQAVSAYFSYSRSFEELAGEIDSADFYNRAAVSNAAYLANDSHIKLASVLAGLTDHVRLSDRFTNQTTVFASGRTSNQPFAHGYTDANQFNVGARSEFGYSAQLGAVGVTGAAGATVQRSNITTNGVFIVPAPPYPERPTAQENYATTLSLYTEWHLALPGQLTLTAGGGLNKNAFAIHNMLVNNQLFDTTQVMEKSFAAVFTPRASLTKQLGSHASAYASVSTGFTPPLLSNTVANDGTVDLSLKPERAVQYEIGTQAATVGNRLTAQISLYDVENTDKLVSQSANGVTFTTNAGKQRDQGLEASLGFRVVDRPDRPLALVRPWVSYTYAKSTFVDFKSDNNNDANTIDFSGKAVPRVPRNAVAAGLDLVTKPGLYLNGSYQYVDKVPVTFDNSTYVKAYELLGAKVGYQGELARHWLLDLFAGGDNLLGNTYYTFLFVGPNYGGLAQPADGGRGDGYIIPGQYHATFYGSLSLRYRF